MNTKYILKETTVIIVANLIVASLILALGFIFIYFDVGIIENKKALIALSFIPFGISIGHFIKLQYIKKYPQKMREEIISHNDERLVLIKNEANSKSFNILQWIIGILYFAYTFIVPKDIFESLGWWIILVLLLVSFILQGVILKLVNEKYKCEKEEVE